MLPDKAKSVVCSIISLALSFWMNHLVIGQPAKFSAFHWSTSGSQAFIGQLLGWLVGCFGLNGPLRQYFSLYRAVSQREGERKEK